MAFALLLALWLITLGTAFHFTHNWLPAVASVNASAIDRQLWFNFAVLGAVFLITQLTLATFVWRYRAQPRVPPRKPVSSSRAEWAAVVLAATIFMGLSVTGATVLSGVEYLGRSAQADPVRVEVTGMQFKWYFRYPGADGRFGSVKPELVDASLGNPLGIDRADPAAADDGVSSSLVVPAGRDVELTLHAQDVIHSFLVPALRLKQDTVPGMEMHLHFIAHRPGTYDIACAELCGLGHYSMSAKMVVLPAEEYRAWAAGPSWAIVAQR